MSKKLGELVKKARSEKGFTQAQLAKKVKGLTASDISKIERGEKEPEKDVLRELAKALGVTQTSLLQAASGKKETTGSKSTKSAASAKSSKSAGKTAAGTLTLTAAEKKLVQTYRKADADTKKAAVSLLDGSASIRELLPLLLRTKASTSSGSGTGSGTNSGVQDLLNSLLGGSTAQNSEKEETLLGSLLENLIGKRQ